MAAIEEDVEVDEGLVAVARRLRRWKKQRGEVWAAELARKNEEAEAEKRRESEERAATERAIAEAEAEVEEKGTEAAKAAEKRARLARARRIVESEDDEEDGEGVTAAAAATTATATATATATPAANAAADTTTVADPAVAGEETGPTEGAVSGPGAGQDDQDGVRTVWGTDGVTPVGVIKAGATSARTVGRHVVVEVPPVLKHRVPRMTALPHGYSSWEEVRREAAGGRGRGRRVGVGANVELRAARQPGDKVSR